jgi:hypothetical protein
VLYLRKLFGILADAANKVNQPDHDDSIRVPLMVIKLSDFPDDSMFDLLKTRFGLSSADLNIDMVWGFPKTKVPTTNSGGKEFNSFILLTSRHER